MILISFARFLFQANDLERAQLLASARQAKLRDADARVQEAQSQLRSLQDQQQAAQGSESTLKASLLSANMSLEQSQSRCKSLEAQLTTLRAELNQVNERADKLQGEFEATKESQLDQERCARDEAARLQQRLQAVEADAKSQRAGWNEERIAHEAAQCQVSQACDRADAAEQRVAELRTELDKTQALLQVCL